MQPIFFHLISTQYNYVIDVIKGKIVPTTCTSDEQINLS